MQKNCSSKIKYFYLLPFLLVALFGLTTLTSNDIYWHLASGRYIIQNLEIPKHGIFSFTLENKYWVDHEWLLQTFLYLFYKIFGFKGLSVLKLLLYISIYALLFKICARTCRGGLTYFYIFLIFPIIMSTSRLFLRPELFSIIIFLLFFYNYSRLKPWHIFLIGMLWANIHAYFVLGFLLVGADIIARIIKYNKRGIRKAALNLIMYFLGTLVNPYFIKLHLRTIFETRHPIFMKNIAEWSSPFTVTYYKIPLSYIFFIVYSLLFIFALIYIILRKRRIESWRELLLSVLLFALAARSLRFIPIYGFFTFPIFLKYMSELVSLLIEKFKYVKLLLLLIPSVFYAIFNFQILSNRFFPAAYSIVTLGLGLSPKKYSIESIKYLDKVCSDTKIFNTFECGGWIAFSLPRVKTYIDASLLDPDLFLEYQIFIKYPNLLDKYTYLENINFLYIPYYTGQHINLLQYFSQNPRWKLIYLDSAVTIFSKNKNIAFYEPPPAEPKAPNTILKKLIKPHPFDYFNRAVAYAAMNVAQKALTYFRKSLQIRPDDENTLYNLGVYYDFLGKKDQALFFFKKALSFNPKHAMANFSIGKHFLTKGDYEKAREYFLKTGRASKLYIDINFYIGETYFLQKDFETAKKYFRKSKTAKSYSRQGDIKIIEEDYIGAAKMYLKAVEIRSVEKYKKKLQDAILLIPTFN